LVIRKDLPVPLMDKTVVNEFGLLQRLHAAGFPVAEPLWLETDAQRFGGAFIVSRRVAGTSDAATWARDPVRARTACEQLARLLATLHGFKPADLGIAAERAALSAGVHMEQEVAQWMQLFHRRRQEAFPLQEMPLIWLAANIPAALYDRPARVVHGDVGFHNLMFDETGQVTALLDWEFSVLGDPTQDLCFARQFVEPLIPWSEFLAAYRHAGGEPPCVEAEFFYKLWTKTRNAVGCVDAQTLFDTAMPTEMRFALAGHVFAPYMFVDQCETLIEHLARP
jgi:aminoglycoside phosphotransferase (APT) family kinase protein